MTISPIIGLEVHVQLLTRTKVFCGCVNRFNPDQPNTQTCPVCLGLPGSLPVLNGQAFQLALCAALALNCEIARFTKWDRKQYYYPDLPKGYQISQYDLPFSHDGWLDIESGREVRRIRIRRAHLEEDAGKNIHDESGAGGDSRVDLNRAGTPLLEIVTEPDLTSAADARLLLQELRLLLTDLGVSDCNMQEGSLRCDANVNLRIDDGSGQSVATPIVEVKNLNSFSGVEAAIEFELQRQAAEFRTSGRKLGDPGVEKETRGWNAERNETFAQRGKEEAADYRYFPDPDLVPVLVTDSELEELRKAMREAPAARRTRFRREYGLSDYDARVIVDQGRSFADYFESAAKAGGDGKQAANWLTQDVLRELNQRRLSIEAFPVPADLLGHLLQRVRTGLVTVQSGRQVFGQLLARYDAELNENPDAPAPEPATAADIDDVIDEQGLAIVNDGAAIEAALMAAIADSPRAVEDFRAGKQQAAGAMIGKVMKQVRGADPRAVRELLIRILNEGQ